MSDEIKRYRIVGPDDEIEEAHLHESSDGNVVQYEDYQQALAAARDQIIAGHHSILEECLRLLDPAPDDKRSRMAAGLVPCLLYGGIPSKIAEQAKRITELEKENATLKGLLRELKGAYVPAVNATLP